MKSSITKKEVGIVVIVIALVIVGVTSLTYAFWKRTFTQEQENTGTTSCLKISYTEKTSAINLSSLYPVSDETGRNTNPFTFTIKNECDQSANYTVSLESLTGTTLDSAYIAAVLDEGEVKKLNSYQSRSTIIADSIESHILTEGTLAAKEGISFDLRLWIPSDITTTAAMNKEFMAKIIVDGTVAE